MAIDSKFADRELATFFSINCGELGIESRHYSWKSKLLNYAGDRNEMAKIIEDRSLEIRETYENVSDLGEKKLLEEEWISLIIEKDKNLRNRIEEENEQLKRNYIQQLYNTLQALGKFDFTNQRDAVLRKNLAKMFHQVGKYCTRNDIDVGTIDKNERKHNSDDSSSYHHKLSISKPMPPPPPPPPPCIFWADTNLTRPTKKQRVITQCTPKKECGLASTLNKYTCNTPIPGQSLNREILKRIQSGCVSDLKSTPCKRSPGGTPIKKKRRLSESDTSDLITIALRRKFQNALVYSPNENKSPTLKSPSAEFP